MKPYLKRAWAEVSLPQLRKNYDIIKSLNSPSTEIMAVVKADAYGHGDEHIIRCLAEDCGVKYFAVSNLDEAIAVRKLCPDAEILILGFTPGEYAHEISMYNIIQGVVSSIMTAGGFGTPSTTVLPTEIVTAVEEAGFFESIPLWAVTLIGGLFIWVLSFIMIMTVYGRFFKLYMYTAIAPIPLSTFAGEPSQSVGISFINYCSNFSRRNFYKTFTYERISFLLILFYF